MDLPTTELSVILLSGLRAEESAMKRCLLFRLLWQGTRVLQNRVQSLKEVSPSSLHLVMQYLADETPSRNSSQPLRRPLIIPIA